MNAADKPYDQLRKRYADSLTRKHGDLAQAWHIFVEKPGDAAARDSMHAQIHQLSGSAPSYGYIRIGALAHALDVLMSQPEAGESTPTDFARVLDAPIHTLLGALVEVAALAAEDLPEIP